MHATCAIIGSIGFDSTKIEGLTRPVTAWRKFWFTLARASTLPGWLIYGVYTYKQTILTYDDILYDQKKNMSGNFFNYKLDMSDPFIKIMYDKYISQNKDPPCYTIVSNHQGYLDILTLMWKYTGAFVAQYHMSKVWGIGKICTALSPLWVKKFSNTYYTVYLLVFTFVFIVWRHYVLCFVLFCFFLSFFVFFWLLPRLLTDDREWVGRKRVNTD